MSETIVAALTDVLDFQEGPGIMAVDFREQGVPLIRLAGLKSGADLLAGCNYLDPAKVATRWNHFRLEAGDVLLSTSASLGEVAEVSPERQGAIAYTGIIRFRPRDERVAAEFIRFALESPEFKQQIVEMGVGSVMNHFGPTHLKHMTLRLPEVSQQRAIADVLGALDDKIAVNRILTDTAVSLVDAEYARWSRASVLSELTFGTVADVGGGGTPRTSVEEYWDGSVSWATPTDVTALRGPYLTTTSRAISEAGLATCSSPLYPPGSILMTSRATIGAFAIAQKNMAVNQGFIVVNAHEPDLQWWLFHDMRSRIDEFVSHANGATFLELSRGKFRQFRVRLADETTLQKFKNLAEAVHGRARAAMFENVQLAAIRDTLLPQLMSGRITVKDAKRAVGRVV